MLPVSLRRAIRSGFDEVAHARLRPEAWLFVVAIAFAFARSGVSEEVSTGVAAEAGVEYVEVARG